MIGGRKFWKSWHHSGKSALEEMMLGWCRARHGSTSWNCDCAVESCDVARRGDADPVQNYGHLEKMTLWQPGNHLHAAWEQWTSDNAAGLWTLWPGIESYPSLRCCFSAIRPSDHYQKYDRRINTSLGEMLYDNIRTVASSLFEFRSFFFWLTFGRTKLIVKLESCSLEWSRQGHNQAKLVKS